MVGVTGLEPATSRPPAVRATNCATPRDKLCSLIIHDPRREILTVTFGDPETSLLATSCHRKISLRSAVEHFSPQPYALPTAPHPGILYFTDQAFLGKKKTRPLCLMINLLLLRWLPSRCSHGHTGYQVPKQILLDNHSWQIVPSTTYYNAYSNLIKGCRGLHLPILLLDEESERTQT